MRGRMFRNLFNGRLSVLVYHCINCFVSALTSKPRKLKLTWYRLGLCPSTEVRLSASELCEIGDNDIYLSFNI